jgi:hypothetical protein
VAILIWRRGWLRFFLEVAKLYAPFSQRSPHLGINLDLSL